jgi:hypothetical protein
MNLISEPGENKAWDILSALSPPEVCKAASATYDTPSGCFRLQSFGMDFYLSVRDRTIISAAPGSVVLLDRLGLFFRLAVLRYLVSARDIACTGRPVRLDTIPGGDIFTKGSHMLPLDAVAGKYSGNKQGFVDKGKSLGGEPAPYGDAAVRLFPLPRVPVVLTLWVEDEEFPARADLLFDSTCILHLPTDVIWSVAMMSLLVMTE